MIIKFSSQREGGHEGYFLVTEYWESALIKMIAPTAYVLKGIHIWDIPSTVSIYFKQEDHWGTIAPLEGFILLTVPRLTNKERLNLERSLRASHH